MQSSCYARLVQFLGYKQNTSTEYQTFTAGTSSSNYTKFSFIFLVCVSVNHANYVYQQQESQHSAQKHICHHSHTQKHILFFI